MGYLFMGMPAGDVNYQNSTVPCVGHHALCGKDWLWEQTITETLYTAGVPGDKAQ